MTQKEKIFKAVIDEPKIEHKVLFLNRLSSAEIKEFCQLHKETAEQIAKFNGGKIVLSNDNNSQKEKIFKAVLNEPKKEHKILFLNRLSSAEIKEFCQLHKETAKQIFDYDSEVEKVQNMPVSLRYDKFKELNGNQKTGFQFICALAYDEMNLYQSQLSKNQINKQPSAPATQQVRPISELFQNGAKNVRMTHPYDRPGLKLVGGQVFEVE
jgi:sorbitol-specific phosphotransferase system component IIA